MGISLDYTRAVTAVAEGKGYGIGNVPEAPLQPESGAEALPDELPEEAELEDDNFVDN